MKKIVFLALTIVLTISAAIAAYVFSRNPSSDLFEANVEALADTEYGEYVRCYETIKSDPTEYVFYCGTCSDVPGRWRGGMAHCKERNN